jgi:hypothetical protein
MRLAMLIQIMFLGGATSLADVIPGSMLAHRPGMTG